MSQPSPPPQPTFALRKLVNSERARKAVGVVLALVLATPFALMAAGALTAYLTPQRNLGNLLCAGIAFGIAAVPLVLFAVRFFRFSSIQGLTGALARYGPPDEVMERIDRELKDPGRFFMGQASDSIWSPEPDCVFITANWLVRLCPTGSTIIHLPDLAWVYRRLVARSALMSLGRFDDQFAGVLRNGDSWVFDTWSPRRTEQIIEELLDRRPEVLTGYTGENVELAATADALWAEVLKRRERLAALSADEREEWDEENWELCQTRVLRQDRQAGPA
ncbi:MAG: hypothetical protein ACJ8F7_04140 [Gemmataceae bacterium]